MDDDILAYYERELTFIREMGAEFAKKYPKIANRLLLEPDKCEDPHTERLIEAFSFLGGRIHKKIEDDFPELTEALLGTLYPHYIRPIPSMSIVRFDTGTQTVPPTGYGIDGGTTLYSKPVGGVPCQFVTVYPVFLWPLEVTAAAIRDPKRLVRNAQQCLVVTLKTTGGMSLSALETESLRFYLNGSRQHVFHLYELLFNNVCQVELEASARTGKPLTVDLGHEAIRPVGFEDDEGMMPYPRRSFPGYHFLFEYFCFPEKFLFFDLKGLGRLRGRELGSTLTITIYLDKAAKSGLVLNEETFCMGATPVVNLFSRVAEPIRVEHRKTEYQVIPDIRRAETTEVFSVDGVAASAGETGDRSREFRPFYSLRHHLEEEVGRKGAFWNIKRLPSGRKGDRGTEVFLSFMDWNFESMTPEVETLLVQVTCTNRDLPGRLPFVDAAGDFDIEMAAPVSRIVSLIKPTPTRRVPMGGALHWRIISHLSLNYLSLIEGGEDALREVLMLYDFDDSPATRQQIGGIVTVRSGHMTKRIGQALCRGVQTTITFDEEKFVGASLFLFSAVLERFLGQYVSVNSFSQLIAKTIQRKEVLRKWPPRNGNRVLL